MQNDLEYILDNDILSILLKDRTTSKNIIWATASYGINKYEKIEIKNLYLIKPRLEKDKKEQQTRTKKKAEVFTPSWICNEMNNNVTDTWFGRKDVFNVARDKKWQTNRDKIVFSNIEGKTWQDYVSSTVLEITCGEAPFLVSRYDTTTGEYIKPFDRIGLLDRKIRVVNENTFDYNDWFKSILEAYKSTYGYEYQGDNLFIARKNLLLTFIENYHDRFDDIPSKEDIMEIAKIISWNIWQMDGLKNVVPNADEEYCRIKDWKNDKVVCFDDIVSKKEGRK